MRTLGVDLAAAAKKTAVAVIEWDHGAANLAHLSLDVGDEEILRRKQAQPLENAHEHASATR